MLAFVVGSSSFVARGSDILVISFPFGLCSKVSTLEGNSGSLLRHGLGKGQQSILNTLQFTPDLAKILSLPKNIKSKNILIASISALFIPKLISSNSISPVKLITTVLKRDLNGVEKYSFSGGNTRKKLNAKATRKI